MNIYVVSKTRFVSFVSVWPWLSLWTAVQLKEETARFILMNTCESEQPNLTALRHYK